MRVWPGEPYPLGATWTGLGVNFAIFSAHATRVDLCLFDSPDALGPDRHLRDARQGLHQAALAHSRSAARHVRGAHDRTGARAPVAPGRDGCRADAGAPPRLRPAPRRTRTVELLGLQHALLP